MVFEGIVCGEIRLLVTCHEPPFFGDQQTRLDMVFRHQNSTILNDLVDLLQEWGLFQLWICWFCTWIGCREGEMIHVQPIPSMGLVYVPTNWAHKKSTINVGKYTSPMNPS